MLRSVLGVIVAYILMFILQVAAFMTIYTLVGADWSFKPASYQASTRWTAMQFLVVLVTCIIGGLICAVRRRWPSRPWYWCWVSRSRFWAPRCNPLTLMKYGLETLPTWWR